MAGLLLVPLDGVQEKEDRVYFFISLLGTLVSDLWHSHFLVVRQGGRQQQGDGEWSRNIEPPALPCCKLHDTGAEWSLCNRCPSRSIAAKLLVHRSHLLLTR